MDRTLRSNDAGIALLAVLLGLALLGTVAAAVVAIGIVEYRASRDYLAATKATLVAEAGVSHAVAVVAGPLKSRDFDEILVGADGTGTGDGAYCAPTFPEGSLCSIPEERHDDIECDIDEIEQVECAEASAWCQTLDPSSCLYARFCSFDNDGDWSYDWSCVNDDPGDDGVLCGFAELAAGDELPAEGVAYRTGSYQVRLVNDTEDPSGDPFDDTNDRIVAVSRGTTPDGGEALVKVIIEPLPYPAVVVNGDLLAGGSARVGGACAGVHANGRLEVSEAVTIDGPITADTVVHLYVDPADLAKVESGAPPIDVPRLNPLSYCSDADYVLRDGWIVNMTAEPDSTYLGGGTEWSWNQAENIYKLGGQPSNLGTFCAHGNVQYTASIGTESEPVPVTIIATGSVQIAGRSRISPAHPDGLLIISGGDVRVGGQAGARYSGLIYGENQCVVGGGPEVEALILCQNDPDSHSYDASDLFDYNAIDNSSIVSYDCSGPRQPPRVTAWWE